MRKIFVTGSACCLLMGLATAGFAEHKPNHKSQIETPIMVSFMDNAGDKIQSDGDGPYFDGDEKVRAKLVANGNLHVDTAYKTPSPMREVFLNFDVRVADGPDGNLLPFDPDPLTGSIGGSIDVFISTTYCILQNSPYEGALRAMVGGQSLECNLNINFADPGGRRLQWFIRFENFDYEPDPTDPRKVMVTCMSSPGVRCSHWVIDTDQGGRNIAKLLSAPTRGRFILSDRGNFYLPTELTIMTLP